MFFKIKRNFAIRQVFAKGTELVTFCNTFSFLGHKIGYHDKLTTYAIMMKVKYKHVGEVNGLSLRRLETALIKIISGE